MKERKTGMAGDWVIDIDTFVSNNTWCSANRKKWKEVQVMSVCVCVSVLGNISSNHWRMPRANFWRIKKHWSETRVRKKRHTYAAPWHSNETIPFWTYFLTLRHIHLSSLCFHSFLFIYNSFLAAWKCHRHRHHYNHVIPTHRDTNKRAREINIVSSIIGMECDHVKIWAIRFVVVTASSKIPPNMIFNCRLTHEDAVMAFWCATIRYTL